MQAFIVTIGLSKVMQTIEKASEKVHTFISVELSMGQMIDDVKLATKCRGEYVLCNRVGGMIPSPEEVLEAIEKANKNGGAK